MNTLCTGHGGKDVAIFTENKFEEILTSLPSYKLGQYEVALREAFHQVDTLLADMVGHSNLLYSTLDCIFTIYLYKLDQTHMLYFSILLL